MFRPKTGEPKVYKIMERFKIKKQPLKPINRIIESEQLMPRSLEKKEELDKLLDKS